MNIEELTTASTFISDFGKDSTSLDIREGPVLHNTEEIKYEDSGVTQLITEDIACTSSVKYSMRSVCIFRRIAHTPDPQRS